MEKENVATLKKTHLITRGLTLYYYKDKAVMEVPRNQTFGYVNHVVFENAIYFEALNMKNALKRVEAFKASRKKLFNLREAGNGINFLGDRFDADDKDPIKIIEDIHKKQQA